MKKIIVVALFAIVSCSRNTEKPLTAGTDSIQANANAFLTLSKGKQMYVKYESEIDLNHVKRITTTGGVSIYMAPFIGDTTKIYAVNTLGKEILYVAQMKNKKNGRIGLMKDGEAIVIEVTDGKNQIHDTGGNEFQARFAGKYHGGNGFCQRRKGESFAACFRAESDEFCDSFISCVALATQPTVVIVIGLACSCNA